MPIGKLIKSLSNTKTRTMVISTGVIVTVGLGIALSQLGEDTDPLVQRTSNTASIPKGAKGVPGNRTSDKYKGLLIEDNKKRYEEAKKKNKSNVPTIIGEDEILQDFLKNNGFQGDGVFTEKDPAAEAIKRQEAILKQQQERLEKIRNDEKQRREADRLRRSQEEADQAFLNSVTELSSAMEGQSRAFTNTWLNFKAQNYAEGAYAQNKSAAAEAYLERKAKTAKNVAQSTTLAQSAINSAYKVKAGSILYGVLETGVNSDVKSPVLARIVSGKYKGARLIGNFKHTKEAESVVLEFTSINLPEATSTFNVSIYAVDPETSRTAVATDVDHHYLFRYGSLFAATFLEGYGKAVKEAGSVQTSGGDTTTTTTPSLTGTQEVIAGLSKVGEKWSDATKKNFDTPVTVTVDEGTAIGLLVMEDIDLDKDVADNRAAATSTDSETTTSNEG